MNDDIQQTHYDGCHRDKGHHACALAKIERLEAELETERMRLAGCGVAALANTKQSAEQQRIGRDSPYWCASYQDVCDAVDREMALRNELQQVQAEAAGMLDHIADAGEWFRHDGRTHLAIRVQDGADLSCKATRRAALEAALSPEAEQQNWPNAPLKDKPWYSVYQPEQQDADPCVPCDGTGDERGFYYGSGPERVCPDCNGTGKAQQGGEDQA